MQNSLLKAPSIDNEKFRHKNIVIVSDGYKFEEKHKILSNLSSKNVSIIAINGALNNWKLVGDECPQQMKRSINYYVVNNPYKECMRFAPKNHRYFPKCIASSRTYKNFVKNYRGDMYLYSPSLDGYSSGIKKDSNYKIDDYRNPICASLSLAYRFGAEKILMLCCDNTFSQDRDASVKIGEEMLCYPQQI